MKIIREYFLSIAGDIGGSLGLFIGASMLTILEIVDLALIQLPIFKHSQKRQTKEKETLYKVPLELGVCLNDISEKGCATKTLPTF